MKDMKEIQLVKDDAACIDGRTAYNIYLNAVKVGRWVNSKNGLVLVRWYINGTDGTDLDAGRLFADAGRARDYVHETAVIKITRDR